MPSSDYVHLHVHTQYSLLDGACRINKLVEKAAEYNMPALGMTDHGNVFGAVDFYQSCVKHNIKPIIGCEAYVAIEGTRHDKSPRRQKNTSHLVLFAKDHDGYKNLMRLVSMAYLEGFYYHPRMDKDILTKYSKGLLCTSACLKGEVATHLMNDDYAAALKSADDFSQIFGKENFYIELMDHGIDLQKKVNQGLIKIANQLDLPLVVTNDVHYLEQNQSHAHDALLCIQTQTTLDDPKRMRLHTDQFFFKDPMVMKREFNWAPPTALTNTVEIADKCNLKMDFSKYHLPHYEPPKGKTQQDYLKELCEQGLKRRYNEVKDVHRQRLAIELDVINQMGFVSYFLIVWDFINYAKSKGIPVGPGRGSAAGSIVSYLLGITDLDPIAYGLLFERFLNKDRAGMPDIDIDFCYERRGEVIDYVSRKYGSNNVAQIITFGTMQARAAIRDVGRVMGAPYSDVDRIAKIIPNELGITIDEALEKEPQLSELRQLDRMARNIIDTARTLEGLNRHASTHAAGVVIADKPLYEYVPLFKTSDGQISTGYSMSGIAKIGLLKMDFLGLRTLTVISEAVKLIKENRNIDLDINNIPLTDQRTYQLLQQAQTSGIFQLESSGMRDLLKKAQPTDFEDIISILALYRPGPMGSGMLDDFIRRKRGETPIKYDHPKLEPILKETYGIIVYQEQVMKIPVALAGFSLVQADHLRRAMSKKIQSVMDQMRKDFVEGCQKVSGIDSARANKLFDLIDYFSGYGFNRSHSAAYALISYQTAYLKANYTVEYMAALLTSERDNTDKVVEYVKACEAIGIKVLPPNINASFKKFTVVGEHEIRYGLLALKNVGGLAIDSIINSRQEKGPFSSMNDLCERADLRLMNRKVLESLVKSGSLDDFKAARSQLMSVIDVVLDAGAKKQKEQSCGQFSFFDMPEDEAGFNKGLLKLPDIKEWPENQLLSFEKEVLGFYLSGHPLSHYQVEIKEFTDTTTQNLEQAHEDEDVRLVGMISKVKLTNTRRTNERMAILRVEDMQGEIEAVVFPSDYANLSHYIREGEVVFLKGKVSKKDNEAKIIVNGMKLIKDVYGIIKTIKVDLARVDQKALTHLKAKLKSSPGKVPVYLNISTNKHKSLQILVGEDLYVSPNEDLMNEIKEIVGKKHFSVTM